MNTYADKRNDNKCSSVANGIPQKKNGGEATFQFSDNRPEAVAQRRLQEIANNSLRVNQLKALQSKTSEAPIVQMFRDDYLPDHTHLTVPNHHSTPYNQDTFQRPAGWYEGTFDELWRRGTTRLNPFSHNPEIRCPNTHQWVTASGVDIGHIQNWKPYVAGTNPANTREARWAYNDLANLQLEERLGNSSHDWERDDAGNFKDVPSDDDLMKSYGGKNMDEYDLDDGFTVEG